MTTSEPIKKKPIREILGRMTIYKQEEPAMAELSQMTRRQVYSYLKARGYCYSIALQEWRKP